MLLLFFLLSIVSSHPCIFSAVLHLWPVLHLPAVKHALDVLSCSVAQAQVARTARAKERSQQKL